MSQETGNAEDRPLSGAEARRLESEIAKNEAERAKLALETRWYSRRVYIQAVVAGIVLALLGLGWFFGYFRTVIVPLIQREQNIQELKLQELELENNVARLQIVNENEELKAKRKTTISDKKNLAGQLDNLSAEYRRQAEKLEASEAEKRELRARSYELLSDSATQKIQIAELESAQQVTFDRSVRLEPLRNFFDSLGPRPKRGVERRTESGTESRPFRLFNIKFDPTTPGILKLTDIVNIQLEYTTFQLGGVRILVEPFTNESPSPGSSTSKSRVYASRIDILSFGDVSLTPPKTASTVDQIRIRVLNNETNVVLMEFFEEVHFEFR